MPSTARPSTETAAGSAPDGSGTPTEGTRRDARLRGMALVACGTGLAAVAVHLALVADTRVPAPFLDDWDALLGFEVYWLRAESLAARLHLLFDPHNEHLLAVPRAIALAVQAATGRFDLTTLNVVGNVCIALLLLALWQGRSRGRHARSEQLVIFLPAVLLVAQPQAWTAVISPTVSLSNLGVMALAAGCFASLASRRRSALAGAVLCAAAAPFCSANGILVAPQRSCSLPPTSPSPAATTARAIPARRSETRWPCSTTA
jgi:hypothetical protein